MAQEGLLDGDLSMKQDGVLDREEVALDGESPELLDIDSKGGLYVAA